MSSKNSPFSSGSEYASWSYRNCDRCIKAGDASIPSSSNCDIFESIHDAAAGIDVPAVCLRGKIPKRCCGLELQSANSRPQNHLDEIATRFGQLEGEKFSIYRDCQAVLRTRVWWGNLPQGVSGDARQAGGILPPATRKGYFPPEPPSPTPLEEASSRKPAPEREIKGATREPESKTT